MPSDFNAMQAQLGLVGAQGSFNPLGIPTPAPPPPMVKHPGQAAADLVSQTQSFGLQNLQQAQMTRPNTGGGIYNPAMGMDAMSSFAQQYRSNMQGIQSNQFNPYVAQMMSGMGGGGGSFMPGMMPSPIQMTNPGMGIFRPFPQAPSSQVPPVPQMPLIPTPFTPQMPHPSFQTPATYGHLMEIQRGQQFTAAAVAAPGAFARALTDVGGGMAMSGLGAYAGARIGGPTGALIGGAFGLAAGAFGSEHFGFGATAQHMADNMNPFRRTAIRGQQMQGMSQEFVVGGAEMSGFGRGLNPRSAMHVGRMLEDLGGNSQFRRDTGNAFTTQDLTRITQASGQNGLLDMAQGSEQIVSSVKTIAKALKGFMQVAGEPDVMSAIQQMGRMRQMGLTLPETMATMRDAHMYARMAGTTVKSLMDNGGAQGAMTFQQGGLSAGLGLQMGAGAFGMARQAVAAGTYSPAQLAMLGGTSGLAQRTMESSLAMLKQPMLAASMSHLGPGGGFEVNGRSIENLLRGHVGVGDMATMGANNINAAISNNRGGVGALAMLQAQMPELQDQIGRTLGPLGMKAMTMRQMLNTQHMLGAGGAGGFVMAGMAHGMDAQTALALQREASNPEFMRNMQRQLEVQRHELRASADVERRASAPGWVDRLAESSTMVRGMRRDLGSLSSGFREGIENAGAFFSEMGEGVGTEHTRRNLLASSPEEARLVGGVTAAQRQAYRRNLLAPAMRSMDGTGTFLGIEATRGRFFGGLQNAMGGDAGTMADVREAEGGIGSVVGGGVMERMFNAMTGRGSGMADELKRRGASISDASHAVNTGLGASVSEQEDMQKRVASGLGGNQNAAAGLIASFSSKLAGRARGRNHGLLGGQDTLHTDDIDAAFNEAATASGISASAAAGLKGDVVTAGMQQAQVLSGATGSGAFKRDSMQRSGRSQRGQTLAAIEKTQAETADDLFGKRTSIFETDTKRIGAMKKVFASAGSDPRVATLAVLMAAEISGDTEAGARLEQYKKNLGSDGAQLISRAQSVLTANKDSMDYMARAGSKIKNISDDKELTDKIGGEQGSSFSAMFEVQRQSGAEKLFAADSSSLDIAKGGDNAAALMNLANNPEALSKASPQLQALAKRFAAGDSSAKEDLEQLEYNSGTASGTETRGGNLATGEKGVDTQQGGFAELAGDALKEFPGAVETFASASRALQNAAMRLGGDTALAPSVNDGNH